MGNRCVQDEPEKRKGRGDARGQGFGPLGRPNPTNEELIMGKADKAVELVDKMFDEGFENYSKIKAAERQIDFLLDMCGAPHGKKKKKMKETTDLMTTSMPGRPYDAPKQLRVTPTISVDGDDEIDIEECGAIEGEPYPGEFDGAAPNDLPEEEPAKEMTPQKKQNKINHVPNQDASGLLMALKGEMVKEEIEKSIRERLRE